MFFLRIARKFSPATLLNFSRFASTDLVRTQVDDKSGIAVVTMNRAPVNSMNLELLQEMSSALDVIEKNKSRGMILTGSSNTAFCAGFDIMELYKPDQARLRDLCLSFYDVWKKLFSSAFPTAAAINGHSIGGGCVLALCCEYRVMKQNFTIGLNEVQLHMVITPAFMLTAESVLPRRETERAITLGKLFSSEKALEIGLVDQVADTTEEMMTKCVDFINLFARVPKTARSLTKQAFRQMLLQRLDIEQDQQMFMQQVNKPQVQKILQMYIEKTKK